MVQLYEFEGYSRTIDTHIKNLHKKNSRAPAGQERHPFRLWDGLPAQPGRRLIIRPGADKGYCAMPRRLINSGIMQIM